MLLGKARQKGKNRGKEFREEELELNGMEWKMEKNEE